MISNCKDEFSWCPFNKKVHYHNGFHRNEDGTKCLAVELNNLGMTNLNCSKEMYFACEVIYFFKMAKRIY